MSKMKAADFSAKAKEAVCDGSLRRSAYGGKQSPLPEQLRLQPPAADLAALVGQFVEVWESQAG